ncbi:hypothetical protein BDP27DRAFT_1370802 [Rhodocollybia butyracea]|uniref:Uncharacterized protein n=1 Tax=Rhodocollybia butyracea TaxID=206335 RepID=A0A9P5P8D5_9AGAR|nr:hypothetical protein BDP27DRAFT_1370802 [Rhodocollybia butyracea]
MSWLRTCMLLLIYLRQRRPAWPASEPRRTYPESTDGNPAGPPSEEWKIETVIPAPPLTPQHSVFKKCGVALLSTGNEIWDLMGQSSSSEFHLVSTWLHTTYSVEWMATRGQVLMKGPYRCLSSTPTSSSGPNKPNSIPRPHLQPIQALVSGLSRLHIAESAAAHFLHHEMTGQAWNPIARFPPDLEAPFFKSLHIYLRALHRTEYGYGRILYGAIRLTVEPYPYLKLELHGPDSMVAVKSLFDYDGDYTSWEYSHMEHDQEWDLMRSAGDAGGPGSSQGQAIYFAQCIWYTVFTAAATVKIRPIRLSAVPYAVPYQEA